MSTGAANLPGLKRSLKKASETKRKRKDSGPESEDEIEYLTSSYHLRKRNRLSQEKSASPSLPKMATPIGPTDADVDSEEDKLTFSALKKYMETNV